MTPLVSIIIPTYNRVEELRRALNSVFCQTYSNWEICIVDNHSTDNTIKLINSLKDSRLKLLQIQNNGVIAASRNLGIKNAKGKYLAFLDSDDWWVSTKLEESVRVLEKGASVVYHDLHLVTKKNQKFFLRKAKTRKLKTPIFDDLIIKGNALITSSVVLNKEIMSRIGGFCEEKNLIAIEDYDAWLQLAKFVENFEKIPKKLGYYWSGGGNTSNPKRTIDALDAIEKKYHDEISILGVLPSMYWFNYNKARAFYVLGMKREAIQSFNLALVQKPTFQIKLKCVFMLFIINIQDFYNKINTQNK